MCSCCHAYGNVGRMTAEWTISCRFLKAAGIPLLAPTFKRAVWATSSPFLWVPKKTATDVSSSQLSSTHHRDKGLSEFHTSIVIRSHWLRGLRHGPAVCRLLGLRVRIPPGSWMSVACNCCVLSSRGFCVGLITCPEESYRG